MSYKKKLQSKTMEQVKRRRIARLNTRAFSENWLRKGLSKYRMAKTTDYFFSAFFVALFYFVLLCLASICESMFNFIIY